ncbi:MAG: protein kinase [Pirellula sp.]|nr:protein kinase [Pirellula sp.]
MAEKEPCPPDSVLNPLQSLIADFLDAEGRGVRIDREAWLAKQASQADCRRDFLAKLDHPRIAPIYEVGQHAGQHYLSIGYVGGQSLSQKLVRGPLSTRDATEMLVKICDGIAYAHERVVIHRDLKPANILLDQNERFKVTDFRLAKKLDLDSNLTGTDRTLYDYE